MASEAKRLSHRTDYPLLDPTHHAGKLAGRVVLLTGASRGIGRSCAAALVAAGAKVACVGRNSGALGSLVTELSQSIAVRGPERRPEEQQPAAAAIAIQADLLDTSTHARIVAETEHQLGAIDVLVNCAGMLRFNSFAREPVDLDDWWRTFDLCFGAPVRLTRCVLPGMIQRSNSTDGHRGVIVSFGSKAGIESYPFCSAYATAKAALLKFYQELQTELAGKDICTFVVHPGEVDTGAAMVPGALDMAAVVENPGMAALVESWGSLELQEPELAADTLVALCADPRAVILGGTYIDATGDLERLIQTAQRQGSGPGAA